MADTMFVKDAAKLWDISERRVSTLCKEGKIKGAKKQGKSWIIPVAAEKPADSRVKSGAYIKKARPANLPLPIGISDYRLASSEYYYIDKTELSKNIIYFIGARDNNTAWEDVEYVKEKIEEDMLYEL